MKRTIVLIGMAGAGKTTVGKALAQALGMPFIDTDILFAEQAGQSLQAILDEVGVDGYIAQEGETVLSLQLPEPTVVATGGSVIYATEAVAHLKTLGAVVYLQATLQTIEQRVGNWSDRGFVARNQQSLADVFTEREPLYQAAADTVLAVDGATVASVVVKIIDAVNGADIH